MWSPCVTVLSLLLNFAAGTKPPTPDEPFNWTLLPAYNHSIDALHYQHLRPSRQITLSFRASEDPDAFASSVQQQIFHAVVLENSAYIQHVSCSNEQIELIFDDPDAAEIARQWPSENFVLVTNHRSCNPADDRGVYKVEGPWQSEAAQPLRLSARVQQVSWKDVTKTLELTYGANFHESDESHESMQRRSSSCSVVTKHRRACGSLICSRQGTVSNPAVIWRSNAHGDETDCAKACVADTRCLSFSFNERSDYCTASGKSVKAQAFSKESSGLFFYDRDCWETTGDCSTWVQSESNLSSCLLTWSLSSIGSHEEIYDHASPNSDATLPTHLYPGVSATTQRMNQPSRLSEPYGQASFSAPAHHVPYASASYATASLSSGIESQARSRQYEGLSATLSSAPAAISAGSSASRLFSSLMWSNSSISVASSSQGHVSTDRPITSITLSSVSASDGVFSASSFSQALGSVASSIPNPSASSASSEHRNNSSPTFSSSHAGSSSVLRSSPSSISSSFSVAHQSFASISVSSASSSVSSERIRSSSISVFLSSSISTTSSAPPAQRTLNEPELYLFSLFELGPQGIVTTEDGYVLADLGDDANTTAKIEMEPWDPFDTEYQSRLKSIGADAGLASEEQCNKQVAAGLDAAGSMRYTRTPSNIVETLPEHLEMSSRQPFGKRQVSTLISSDLAISDKTLTQSEKRAGGIFGWLIGSLVDTVIDTVLEAICKTCHEVYEFYTQITNPLFVIGQICVPCRPALEFVDKIQNPFGYAKEVLDWYFTYGKYDPQGISHPPPNPQPPPPPIEASTVIDASITMDAPGMPLNNPELSNRLDCLDCRVFVPRMVVWGTLVVNVQQDRVEKALFRVDMSSYSTAHIRMHGEKASRWGGTTGMGSKYVGSVRANRFFGIE